MRWYNIDFWQWLVITCLAFLLTLMLTDCKGKEYVTAPRYRTEYVVSRDTVAVVDSIAVRDSILVYRNGDSIVTIKTLSRDRYKDRWRTRLDTVMITDTISVPTPISGKPPELTTWQRLRLGVGDAVLIIIVLYLLTWLWSLRSRSNSPK